MKRFQQFADPTHSTGDLRPLFTLIALNCALRNGDAHLKNFGVVYDNILGGSRLAPVYDLVTTTVYLPRDSMALTLNGSTRWPSAKGTEASGRDAHGQRARQGAPDPAEDRRGPGTDHDRGACLHPQHPEFAELGGRMLQEWETGSALSLRG